ncbi:uncharacterized protein LOC119467941 [Cebus imitator]|uniref:uncharacterized protein LOC119467941 n=1 Tax=Cebus imitator TaxID=2715852 RepID=UPI00189790CC|nr:uncharacterized protein LOC119467941 [Cebus imitator]
MCEIRTMKNAGKTPPNRYILTSETISNRRKSDFKRERFSQYLCCCFFPEGAFILPFTQKFVFKSVAKGAAARISSKPAAGARAPVPVPAAAAWVGRPQKRRLTLSAQDRERLAGSHGEGREGCGPPRATRAKLLWAGGRSRPSRLIGPESSCAARPVSVRGPW